MKLVSLGPRRYSFDWSRAHHSKTSCCIKNRISRVGFGGFSNSFKPSRSRISLAAQTLGAVTRPQEFQESRKVHHSELCMAHTVADFEVQDVSSLFGLTYSPVAPTRGKLNLGEGQLLSCWKGPFASWSCISWPSHRWASPRLHTRQELKAACSHQWRNCNAQVSASSSCFACWSALVCFFFFARSLFEPCFFRPPEDCLFRSLEDLGHHSEARRSSAESLLLTQAVEITPTHVQEQKPRPCTPSCAQLSTAKTHDAEIRKALRGWTGLSSNGCRGQVRASLVMTRLASLNSTRPFVHLPVTFQKPLPALTFTPARATVIAGSGRL